MLKQLLPVSACLAIICMVDAAWAAYVCNGKLAGCKSHCNNETLNEQCMKGDKSKIDACCAQCVPAPETFSFDSERTKAGVILNQCKEYWNKKIP
jgi:hypothetical protein